MARAFRIISIAAFTMAATVCLAAADAPDAPDASKLTALNFLSIALFLLVAIAVIVWAVMTFQHKLADRQAEETKAGMMLEASVGVLLEERKSADREGVSPSPALVVQTAPDRAAPPPVEAVVPAPIPAAPAPASAPAGASLEATQAVEAVIEKLRAGGLFAGLEGSIYMSDGCSEGKIVRLTDGKTAVVLPSVESGEFLARQIKRFDLCIVALGGGEAGVIRPLGAHIADRFSL